MTSQFSPHASHSQKAATSHSALPSHHHKTHPTNTTTTTTCIDTNILTSSRTSNSEQGPRKHHLPPTATSPRTSKWQPKLDRSQSWNEQDMKHKLQQRLTGLEKGRESGFTEIEKEIEKEMKEMKEAGMGGGRA